MGVPSFRSVFLPPHRFVMLRVDEQQLQSVSSNPHCPAPECDRRGVVGFLCSGICNVGSVSDSCVASVLAAWQKRGRNVPLPFHEWEFDVSLLILAMN
jgi:hypothetical protein